MKLCVVGAGGRMGQYVLELAGAAPDIDIVAAVDHPESPLVGTQVAAGVTVDSDVEAAVAAADVYVDFSVPAATAAAAHAGAKHKVAGVVGTTGLDAPAESALAELARHAPMLLAANFSLGVNLLMVLAEKAAAALPGYDLEVVELHHNKKRDAPSGTAIALAKALAAGRGLDYDHARRYSREGNVGERPADEIGVVAVRGGDVIGEHTAYLVGGTERIELSHRAANRSLFADGALRAARWLHDKQPGRYTMRDVLGL